MISNAQQQHPATTTGLSARPPGDAHPPSDRPARTGAPAQPGRWRRWLFAAFATLAILSQLAPVGLRAIGHWLIVEDELQQADVIFVHAGPVPFRALEAAEIYRGGWAKEVWLAPIAPTEETLMLRRLGIDRPPSSHWRRQVLQKQGVRPEAIDLLSSHVLNTNDEIASVVAALRSRGHKRVILVTSKQHSRRVRVLWDRIANSDLEAIVRPSASDPFDPDSWWRNTEDGQAVLHELVGLLNIWIGAGLRPERD